MDQSRQVKPDPRRALPAVDRLVSVVGEIRDDVPLWAVREGVRRVLAAERERLSAGADPCPAPPGDEAGLAARALAEALRLARPHPTRVVNATGVVLHTNLGRAPLAPGAAAAVAAVAGGYGNLELDLESGRRGDRQAAVASKLCLLTGAEGALAVNNNAAALVLALDTLARGREVIVSRGELVEIGGSFRVPEIMERAGVRLVEVGSTNRTHLRDYERAVGPATALLLKVHRSNFEQRGFTAEVGLRELSALGRARTLPVLEDLGSGTLVDLSRWGFPEEAYAPARLRLGADLVCFSGDKLLGGPQAGIVLGAAAHVSEMRGNPLARALRLDKLSLAALDWTLECILDGRAQSEIPVLQRLLEPPARLRDRADGLAERLAQIAGTANPVAAAPDRAAVGGGSLPGFELDTWVVTLKPAMGAERFAAALRAGSDPVLARVQGDVVLFDVRTLLEGEEAVLEKAVGTVLGTAPR